MSTEPQDSKHFYLVDYFSTEVTEIKQLHSEMGKLNLRHWKKSLPIIIRLGGKLTNLKEKVSHGQWLPFFEANQNELGFSERTMRRYIRAYEIRDELKSASVADLTDAYALMDEKDPAERQSLLEEAQTTGETIRKLKEKRRAESTPEKKAALTTGRVIATLKKLVPESSPRSGLVRYATDQKVAPNFINQQIKKEDKVVKKEYEKGDQANLVLIHTVEYAHFAQRARYYLNEEEQAQLDEFIKKNPVNRDPGDTSQNGLEATNDVNPQETRA